MDLASSEPSRPLVVWAVSDGRAGIEAQVVGLAEAVARRIPAHIVPKRIAWKGRIGALPWRLNPGSRRWLTQDSRIDPPWPDLWIAAGRATLPLSTRMRRWSGGRTFVVQLQDPRAPSALFDLVAPPRHDRVEGDNVFSIIGSPHRLNPERLAADLARFADMIEPLPHPRVAVLIGGKSKAFDLSVARAATLAQQIEAAVAPLGGALLTTFSRRTPPDAAQVLKNRLGRLPGVLWDGQGPNPYFAFLAAADFILVTEDSTNMAAEAASTGKPVFILKMDGDSPKFRRFHRSLEDRGAARPFTGALHGWRYEPLDETGRLADEVVRRLTLAGIDPVHK